jgi:hypothetical protein
LDRWNIDSVGGQLAVDVLQRDAVALVLSAFVGKGYLSAFEQQVLYLRCAILHSFGDGAFWQKISPLDA